MGQSMGRFESADDTLRAGEESEGVERLPVRRTDIFGAAAVLEEGMLRSYRRIIQAGRDGPAVRNLPVRILQHVGFGAMQHAWPSPEQRRAMFGAVETLASRFDPDQPHRLILYKVGEIGRASCRERVCQYG